jgi:hypothetical protein
MHSPGTCLRQKTLTRGDTEEFSHNADARTPKNTVGPRNSTREQLTIWMLNPNTTSIQRRNIDVMHELLSMRLANICCARAVTCDRFGVLVAETSHSGGRATRRRAFNCDVSMSVEALMSEFPGQRVPVDGAEFVGDCLLIKEQAARNIRQPPTRTPGRPPAFAREAFHVEIADLIRSGRLLQKKRGCNSPDDELV